MIDELSPNGRDLATEYREVQQDRRHRSWLRIAMVTGAVGAVLAGLALVPAQQVQTATTQRSVLADKANAVADPILTLCSGADDTARRLSDAGLCGKAAAVKSEAAQAAPVTVTLSPSISPALAYAAVAQYCADHNGCRGAAGQTPDFAAIVAAVQARIPVPANGANGKDAPTITSDEILAQVTAYCGQSTHPCQGTTGAAGKDGKDGTAGKDGANGSPGVSITGQHFARDSHEVCHSYVSYSDGSSTVGDAGEAACTP